MSAIIAAFNITFNPDALVSNSSLSPQYVKCRFHSTGVVSFTSFTVANTFLLPLYILVLYKGVQQRHSPGETSVSHSNLVTCNMAVMEMVTVFGLMVYSWGINTSADILKMLGNLIFSFFFPGQTFFHCLTCMEHYLAVVHPITYRRLRKTNGLRVRQISCGCVWLLCLLLSGVGTLPYSYTRDYMFNFILTVSIVFVLGCYISILHVLMSPKPGEAVKAREVVDHSKQKASSIIKIILVAQVLRIWGFFSSFSLSKVVMMPPEACLLMNSGIWLTLPGSLVLPLLFLHRAGNVPFCRLI